MSDFDLQRRLRALNVPRTPRHDEWPAIEARIGDARGQEISAGAQRLRRDRWPFAAAAALLLALGVGALMLAAPPAPLADGDASATRERENADDAMLRALREARVAAKTRAPGGDPRLLGAAVVLDSAHAELEQALERRPDAVFLVSLLNRTNARRMKLDHFGADAG